VERALAAADTELRTRQPDWSRFTVQVAIEVLKSAQEEYESAVAKERVAQPVVYQTARGFILQADRMIEAIAADLQQRNPLALADMRQGLAQLKQAFGSVNSPKKRPFPDPHCTAWSRRSSRRARRFDVPQADRPCPTGMLPIAGLGGLHPIFRDRKLPVLGAAVSPIPIGV
jgi:hypothetical protein